MHPSESINMYRLRNILRFFLYYLDASSIEFQPNNSSTFLVKLDSRL